jgi:8-oxo-dGTP pyrophosphatase MutT (NUDIX family)
VRADGVPGTYAVVDKPDYALVVPVEEDGSVHLVEQWRYAVGRRCLEFPAGRLDDPAVTDLAEHARGELLEETGLKAGRLELLGRLEQAPSYSVQGCGVFVATELSPGTARPSPQEHGLRSVRLSRDAFERALRESRVTDAATIAAWALLRLHGRW